MRAGKTIAAALLAVITLGAQPQPREITAAQQPELQVIAAAVRALRRTSTVSDEVKAKADQLSAEAQAGGMNGEARRRMANAYALLKGQSWDEKQEYAWSLALRPDAVVADSSLPFVARLTQTYPASLKATGLQVRVSLIPENSKEVRVGTFDLPARDLIEQPLGLDASLEGKSDGAYTLS
ncbi:MAG: hypothetical protein ABUS51_10300, partial [Acidobacteriota bacterium]